VSEDNSLRRRICVWKGNTFVRASKLNPIISHGGAFLLEAIGPLLQSLAARAHGMWTYKPRQGRKAATVVCSTSAVVTLVFLQFLVFSFEF
jgi:hypothetical protein